MPNNQNKDCLSGSQPCELFKLRLCFWGKSGAYEKTSKWGWKHFHHISIKTLESPWYRPIKASPCSCTCSISFVVSFWSFCVPWLLSSRSFCGLASVYSRLGSLCRRVSFLARILSVCRLFENLCILHLCILILIMIISRRAICAGGFCHFSVNSMT